MADNLTTTTTVSTVPSGTKLAAREVTYSGDGNTFVAPVGLVIIAGSDDAKTATDVSNSAPLPVSDAGGTITVDDGGITVSVDDGGTVLSVDDGNGSLTVDDGSGTLTVDAPVGTPVFVRLSDGAAAISTLPVSAASLPLPSGAATAAKQPALGTAGTASTDVITIQGIASGTVVPVADGGGSLTVDGTVAVTNAGLTALNGAIAGTEVQVDVLTMPTVTVNSHAVTNAGTFATQVDGAALTALQLIDDPVATLGTTTYTEAATKGMIIGAVRRDANTALVDTTNEVGPLQLSALGSLKVAIIEGGGTGGTSATDDAAFTVGSGTGTPIMGYAAADSVDAGDSGVIRMTTARGMHVYLVDSTGAAASLTTTTARATTSTMANVSGATSSTTLQASNTARLGLVVVNDSTADLYVKFGSSASSTSYTHKLGPGDSFREDLYTGIVTGIWTSATGAARMTELTA